MSSVLTVAAIAQTEPIQREFEAKGLQRDLLIGLWKEKVAVYKRNLEHPGCFYLVYTAEHGAIAGIFATRTASDVLVSTVLPTEEGMRIDDAKITWETIKAWLADTKDAPKPSSNSFGGTMLLVFADVEGQMEELTCFDFEKKQDSKVIEFVDSLLAKAQTGK